MKKYITLFAIFIFAYEAFGQIKEEITFTHDKWEIHGSFQKPKGKYRRPTIIVVPGSGSIDRYGTVTLSGVNAVCLYPQLINSTLTPYAELSSSLANSGYNVLTYDKLEYSYGSELKGATFSQLWLPFESAIDYVKTRKDVDSNNIILLGHSEGASLMVKVAKKRPEISCLISIAGSRSPLDSLLVKQLINLSVKCLNSDSSLIKQASQIATYFDIIRKKSWDDNTPSFVGISPNVWYEYVSTNDSLVTHLNELSIPKLFIGFEEDVNVPVNDLMRFQYDVKSPADFIKFPGITHYLTAINNSHISELIPQAIVKWLEINIRDNNKKKR
jgi:dienelactone hydrolase